MPTVIVPALLRDLTGGQERLDVPGENVQAVIDALEARCPGVKARLYQGDRLRPGIAVVVDGAITRRGLRQALAETSEVQFLPALSGGSSSVTHPRGAASPRARGSSPVKPG